MSDHRIDVDDCVWLSPVTQEDGPRCVELLNDVDVYERLLRVPHPYGEEDFQHFLQTVNETTAKHGHPLHYVVRDVDDGLIGGFGFEGVTYGHRAEIGYWLGKPFWGQGIMTEVVRAACEFAFESWKLVRITATVFDFNHASARVVEKNGFRFEGLLRNYFRKQGEFIDGRLFALTSANDLRRHAC